MRGQAGDPFETCSRTLWHKPYLEQLIRVGERNIGSSLLSTFPLP